MLQPFDLEFQPFINEIDAKEVAIREYADAVTMKRIRGKYKFIHAVGNDGAKSNTCIQILTVPFRILH